MCSHRTLPRAASATRPTSTMVPPPRRTPPPRSSSVKLQGGLNYSGSVRKMIQKAETVVQHPNRKLPQRPVIINGDRLENRARLLSNLGFTFA